jgi:serine O-acetyltransferase
MLFKRIVNEIDSIIARDPSARSRTEVALCYPGFHARMIHHLTHWLWHHRLKLLARFISNVARMFTGIEIHPAARIGERLFIRHGSGVVIGESTIIGDDVVLYHDVALGGAAEQNERRHPRIGDYVIIGAGAQLIGAIDVGDHARIAANAVVITDVAAGSTVVGAPARAIKHKPGDTTADVYATPNDIRLDPTFATLEKLTNEMESLKAKVAELSAKLRRIDP